jgi:hypothetical protein
MATELVASRGCAGPGPLSLVPSCPICANLNRGSGMPVIGPNRGSAGPGGDS